MATALGLAMKITADASGLQKGLTPVDRALQRLGEQASASAALFDKFLGSTSGASSAQRQFATDVAFLTSELRRDLRTPQEFANEFERLQQAARGTADAFAEGQRLTEQYATSQERQAKTTQRLVELYDLGAIGLQTLNRASADAIGVNQQVAKSEQDRAAFAARAAQLQEQARTPLQRYDAEVQELLAHKQAFNLVDQQFNALLEQSTQRFIRAEAAARGYDSAVETAGRKGNMSFAELSGTLAILPGPIGNIAGRLSGLSSAAEGLNRTFTNGGGIGQFGAAIAGLVNPTTLALGGLAAFGAGAVAVSRGLVQLEGEVERLSQFADRLGVSFGFIQVLETASNQTGTSIENLGGSFTKFLRTVDDARGGSKEAAQAFRDLGISAEDVRDSNPESLFTRSADALAKLGDPARRAAAAVALFGKSGAELIPVFGQLGQAAADIERIGGILTDQQQQDVLAFGDAMDRVGVASQGFSRQVTASFASFGTTVANSTAESIGALNRFMRGLDDTASSKTWLGFQKSAERLRIDQEIIAGRERLRKANEDLAKAKLPKFISDDEVVAAQRLFKTLEDLKAASEDFGTNQELVAAAAARAVDLFSEEANAAGLSADQIKAFVDSANDDFGRFVDGLRDASEAAKKAADDRQKAVERLIEADRQRADAFAQNNGLGREADAAEDLLAITRQIDEAETAIVEARARGDQEAERAAVRRLRILDQAQAAAQDTVDLGFNANDIEQAIQGAQRGLDDVIAKAAEFGQEGVRAAVEFQNALAKARGQLEAPDGGLLDPKGFDAIVAKERQRFEDRVKQIEEIRNLELQLIDQKADLEERRLRDVNAIRSQPLQLADVSTTEGQRQFFQAANLFEDPAVAEYRRGREAIERLERKIDAAKKVEIK